MANFDPLERNDLPKNSGESEHLLEGDLSSKGSVEHYEGEVRLDIDENDSFVLVSHDDLEGYDPNEDNTDKAPIVVVVAGKTGSGKSTALNNLFGLDFEARSSPTAVTKDITELSISRNGETLRIIDTPGLGSFGIPTTRIIQEIDKTTTGSSFTLLYCLPVKPSDILTETDRAIIKNLQSTFGKNVWDNCVVLMTFSDVARADLESTDDYISFLKEHSQAFYNMLRKCGSNVRGVKTVFEYESEEAREQRETVDEIVCVPVQKKPSGKENILPGITTEDGLKWTDIAFIEIMKKTSPKKREQSIIFTFGNIISSKYVRPALGAAVGGAVGSIVGGIPGLLIGGALGFGCGVISIQQVVALLKQYAGRRSRLQSI